MRILFYSLMISLCIFTHKLHSDVHGQVYVAPMFLRVKVQESGRTVKKIDMGAGRIDATILPFEGYGFCLKPFFFGGSGEGDIFSGGCAIGHYTPICEKLAVNPAIGYGFTDLNTRIDLPMLGLKHLRERFRSHSLYLTFEVYFQLTPCWLITGVYQYAWARTHTTIGSIISSHSHSQGSNYAILVDYFLNKNWSINAAVGYNYSLSKEKHGLKAMGAKLGLGYFF